MIYMQTGIYVGVKQLETQHAPRPLPLESGFSEGTGYLVLGGFTMSESGEMFLILSNDRDEIWLISNRHMRTLKISPNATQFRISIPVETLKRQEMLTPVG